MSEPKCIVFGQGVDIKAPPPLQETTSNTAFSDKLRQITAFSDKLRQITAFSDISRHFTPISPL